MTDAPAPAPVAPAPAPAPAPVPAAVPAIAAAPGAVVSPPSGAEILARNAEAKREQDQMLQNFEVKPARRSESIAKLATALSKAQGKIVAAKRTSANPFFKSKYADLASIWDACRQALSENEIAVFQPASARGRVAIITTLLVHSSGEFIEEPLMMVAESDRPQAVGSTITYGRRYGLASMVGVATEDDDGQAAENQLPKDTKWDRGQTGRHQQIAGSSDELADQPEASGSVAGPLVGAGGPTPGGVQTAPSVPAKVAPTPVPAAVPAAGSPAPPVARAAAVPVPAGSVPPPPGKPPARAPGAPEKK